ATCRDPEKCSRCGVETVNLAVATTDITLFLGGIGCGIDPATKWLCPTCAAGCRFHCVHPRIGAAEKNNSAAHNRRGPDFAPSRTLPYFRAGNAIDGIHLAVLAAEENLVTASRWSRMNLLGN